MTCANAKRLSIWTYSYRFEGAERMSRAPNWTQKGMRLQQTRWMSDLTASLHAKACIGPVSQSPGDCLDTRSGFDTCGVCSHEVGVCGPSPEPDTNWRAQHAQPAFCIGRSEGTESLLGRREEPPRGSASVTSVMMEPPYVCGAAMLGWHLDREIKSEHTTACRRRSALESGKKQKTAQRGSGSLDTGSPHKC
jgi:hypothetical protein